MLAPYAPLRGVPSPEQQRQASSGLLSATIRHVLGSEVGVRPVLVEGHPAAALLRYAAGAGLLVLGRRRRPGHSDGIALGAVARACITNAQCPAVVVAAAEVVDGAENPLSSGCHCIG